MTKLPVVGAACRLLCLPAGKHPDANHEGDQAQRESGLFNHVTGLTQRRHKTERVGYKLTKGIPPRLPFHQRFSIHDNGFPHLSWDVLAHDLL